MEAEEKWTKELSAQKRRDEKVHCKRNGGLGKVFPTAFTAARSFGNVPRSITRTGN